MLSTVSCVAVFTYPNRLGCLLLYCCDGVIVMKAVESLVCIGRRDLLSMNM